MTAKLLPRYRLDDLRRLGTAMAAKVGVSPARASALAGHLLWFDAADASAHGIATLPSWLDRIEAKQIDGAAEGRAALEHAGTAVFDARNGLPPLALEAAAGVASEKARDVGIGIVRVRNIGPTGPSAFVASNLAIGPYVAVIAGPSPSLTIALPTAEGLPAIYDSMLGEATDPPAEGWLGPLAPWVATLSGDEGWAILAVSVAAMEPLTTFHDRVVARWEGAIDGPGRLSAATMAGRRREARERGVRLDAAAVSGLKAWAGQLDVPWPDEIGT